MGHHAQHNCPHNQAEHQSHSLSSPGASRCGIGTSVGHQSIRHNVLTFFPGINPCRLCRCRSQPHSLRKHPWNRRRAFAVLNVPSDSGGLRSTDQARRQFRRESSSILRNSGSLAPCGTGRCREKERTMANDVQTRRGVFPFGQDHTTPPRHRLSKRCVGKSVSSA